MFWKSAQKLFDLLSSLEVAVFVILALAAVLTVGTIVESKYGAAVASQLVYRSFWNQGILWLLLINVTAAAASRLPWKKHHVGFLVTHLGIVTLLLGSFLTQRFGIDGLLALAPGETGRLVRLDEMVLNVFRARSGESYELLLSKELSFHPLKDFTGEKRFALPRDGGDLRVVGYLPRAAREVTSETVSDGQGVPAIQYRLEGSRANLSEWAFLQGKLEGTTRELGPARLRFQRGRPTAVPSIPTLFVFLEGKNSKPQLALVRPRSKKLEFLGPAQEGKPVALGWMDFRFVLDRYLPSASPKIAYRPLPKTVPTDAPGVFQALEVDLGGDRRWLELGASSQFAKGEAIYYVQFARRQADIGFDLGLKDFRISYHEGTNRPKEYESHVTHGGRESIIRMNEPLYQAGFTFYQSSYEADEMGKPRLSVLSVNRDPGRPVKYAGSLMIVAGIISMFYFKPRYSGKNRLLKRPEAGEANA